MEKTLTLVGNSKAVILPAQMVKKLGGDKVIIGKLIELKYRLQSPQ